MTINEDSARRIVERFQNAEPDGRYKQPRAVSRRELVGSLYEAIMAKRRAGYSFEGIASQLEELGAMRHRKNKGTRRRSWTLQ